MSVSVAATFDSPNAVRARPATSADIPAVSHTLAAAFFDDPVFSYCYPEVASRQEILPRWFEIVTEATLPGGEIYTTDDVVAGAVWVPPGASTRRPSSGSSSVWAKNTPASPTTTYSCSVRDPLGNPGASARP